MAYVRSILYAAAFSLFATGGYAEGTVDGSSQQAFEDSIAAMTADISPDEQELFSAGLLNLILTEYPPARGLVGLEALMFAEPAVEAAPITLDGYSFEQIMDRGREIKSPVEPSAPTVTLVDDAGPAEADSLRQCIQQNVLISDARFVRGDFGGRLEFDISNNLPFALAGIHIEYRLVGQGRSVPWDQDDFFLSISGGIEPDETRTITTSARVTLEAGDALILTGDILDVADPELRLLVGEQRVHDWPREQSPMECVE